MLNEIPFFVRNAKVVMKRDQDAINAKNKSAVENARIRFERGLLSEKQRDLDHEKNMRSS
jgi:hypothetical protein